MNKYSHKILVNATTLVKGGAIQVCLSFLLETLRDRNVQWHYALSSQVNDQFVEHASESDKERTTVFSVSPSKSKVVRRSLEKLVATLGVDGVFTVFGPAYARFSVPHLLGVADPWVTHGGFLSYWKLGSLRQYLRKPVLAAYKGIWFRAADGWVVEAECARRGLVKRWGLPREKIHVVPNNASHAYLGRQCFCTFPMGEKTINLLTLSAYYAHKNLEIIPLVASHLKDMDGTRDYKFHLTLPMEGGEWKRIEAKAGALDVLESVVNLGPVPVNMGPDLYERAQIVFLPSLLETFSANYPEAMAMGRPIVTTDMPFAHEVCGTAAVYYRPADAGSAASAILSLVESCEIWEASVRKGKDVLDSLPDPKQKYDLYKGAMDKVFLSSEDGST